MLLFLFLISSLYSLWTSFILSFIFKITPLKSILFSLPLLLVISLLLQIITPVKKNWQWFFAQWCHSLSMAWGSQLLNRFIFHRLIRNFLWRYLGFPILFSFILVAASTFWICVTFPSLVGPFTWKCQTTRIRRLFAAWANGFFLAALVWLEPDFPPGTFQSASMTALTLARSDVDNTCLTMISISI